MIKHCLIICCGVTFWYLCSENKISNKTSVKRLTRTNVRIKKAYLPDVHPISAPSPAPARRSVARDAYRGRVTDLIQGSFRFDLTQ